METIVITQSSHVTAQKYLLDELYKIITNNSGKINKIVTNTALCDALITGSMEKCRLELNKDIREYHMGGINGIDLYVDISLLWTKNEIYLKNNNDTIVTVQVEDNEFGLI